MKKFFFKNPDLCLVLWRAGKYNVSLKKLETRSEKGMKNSNSIQHPQLKNGFVYDCFTSSI